MRAAPRAHVGLAAVPDLCDGVGGSLLVTLSRDDVLAATPSFELRFVKLRSTANQRFRFQIVSVDWGSGGRSGKYIAPR